MLRVNACPYTLGTVLFAPSIHLMTDRLTIDSGVESPDERLDSGWVELTKRIGQPGQFDTTAPVRSGEELIS